MKKIFLAIIAGTVVAGSPLFSEENLPEDEKLALLEEEENALALNEEEGMIYLSVNCIDPEKDEI